MMRGGIAGSSFRQVFKPESMLLAFSEKMIPSVVLKPEVAEAFPNEEAVNSALRSLIDIAQKTTRFRKHSTGDTTMESDA